MKKGHAWLLVAFALSVLVVQMNAQRANPSTQGKRCSTIRSHKMLAADCYGLNLANIPRFLHGDIEILDVSYNRIRELRKADFGNYPDVQYIYLADNLISHIEDGTFSDLQSLEVVNMSLNALHTIPSGLFYLPRLRKLTLDQNILNAANFNELKNLPSVPSLRFLSLAYCKMQAIPPLEKFPHIEFLNISGNALKIVGPRDLAPACFLTTIDLQGNDFSREFATCNCTALKHWTNLQNISVQPPLEPICPTRPRELEHACTNTSLKESIVMFNTCKLSFLEQESKAKWYMIWIYIAIGVVGSLILICVIIFIFRTCCFKNSAQTTHRYSAADTCVNNLSIESPTHTGEAHRNLLVNHNNLET